MIILNNHIPYYPQMRYVPIVITVGKKKAKNFLLKCKFIKKNYYPNRI